MAALDPRRSASVGVVLVVLGIAIPLLASLGLVVAAVDPHQDVEAAGALSVLGVWAAGLALAASGLGLRRRGLPAWWGAVGLTAGLGVLSLVFVGSAVAERHVVLLLGALSLALVCLLLCREVWRTRTRTRRE